MCKKCCSDKKKEIVFIKGALLCCGLFWLSYAVFGYPIVKLLYEHKSSHSLRHGIKEGAILPLELYFKNADQLFYNKILLPLISTLLFILLLYKLYRYFFKKIETGETGKIKIRKVPYDSIIAAILYSICTLLFFYPCITSLGNALIGYLGDNATCPWTIWWSHKALTADLHGLTFTNYLFYPQGVSLLFHSSSFYNIFLALILKEIFNPIATYNILILLTFVVSGISAFLLIKYLTNDSYVSFIGGFVFAFNPSHIAHSFGHIDVASIQFIPLFLLYFIKTVKTNATKHLLLACLFFFLTSICCWYYLVFSLYFMCFSYAYLMWKRKKIILQDIFINIFIIAGSSIALLSPWLLRMFLTGLRHPESSYFYGHDIFVVDLAALLVPHASHLLRDILRPMKDILSPSICNEFLGAHTKTAASLGRANIFISLRSLGVSVETIAYLGSVNIFIILLTWKGIIKKTVKYWCGFFAFLLLAMGMRMTILGWKTPIQLPYRLIMYIPFLTNARCPSRSMVYVYLFLAIIIAFAFKHLLDNFQYPSKTKKFGLLTLTFLLLFFDFYTVCGAKTEVHLPAAYKAIKAEAEGFGILDLPHKDLSKVASYMLYQTYHGIPIVEGYVSRKIGKSLIDYLDFEDLQKQKEQLIKHRVKYIIIHRDVLLWQEQTLQDKYIDMRRYAQCYQTIYEDKRNIVFQVY